MKKNIITGIIYTEVDDTIGPSPIFWDPSDLSEKVRILVSIKTITMLTAEKDHIPQSIAIIPFPSLNLKGIIKYIEIEDETRRGGIYTSAITLLFDEIDDVIFYKGMEYFDSAFKDIAQNLNNAHALNSNREGIANEIRKFRENILNILDDLKLKEDSDHQSEAFPEKGITHKDKINYQFKIIVCGDPMVGKSSIILRFTDNAFKRTYISTMGVNVSQKVINVKDSYIQCVIWDLAGQTKFELMRSAFYKGAKGVLLVFDLTNLKSFKNLKKWYKDITNNLDTDDQLIGFILGNKNDLVEERKITKSEAFELANKFDLEYFETSALTGNNIENSFYKLAEELYLKNKTF
ncbi:MAG: Rab family GTPase [Promethearchaeota archaeon]